MLHSHASNPLDWGSVGALKNPYLGRHQSPHKAQKGPRAQAYEDKIARQRLEDALFNGDESGVLNQVRFVYITFYFLIFYHIVDE